jgi:hypothetical protein
MSAVLPIDTAPSPGSSTPLLELRGISTADIGPDAANTGHYCSLLIKLPQ